jgi:hypothetical protein
MMAASAVTDIVGRKKTTALVAGFITQARFGQLSERSLKLATDAITDAIGVGLYGSRQPISEIMLRVIGTSDATGDHFLLGSTRKARSRRPCTTAPPFMRSITTTLRTHPIHTPAHTWFPYFSAWAESLAAMVAICCWPTRSAWTSWANWAWR